MTTSEAFSQSLAPVSVVPLHEFLAETSGAGSMKTADLVERWHLLEQACDLFMARLAAGETIAGRHPIPSPTALRDILPVLGAEVAASASGFDLASAPKTFQKMVRVRQTAL